MTADEQAPQPLPAPWIRRLLVLAVAVLAAALLLHFFRDSIRLEALAAREAQLRAFYSAHPALALSIAFVAYVAVAGLSLPGAAAMSVLYGWLFGFWPALIVVSFGSTAGATIAFLLARYAIGDLVQARYGARLAALNAAIERDGAFYLLTLRLIPQVPFFVVNAAMGFTRLPVRTFWWVSQIGMLPGTIVYVLAGASAPSLRELAERGLAGLIDWRLIGALALLGIMPLVIRWTLGRRSQPSDEGD